MNAPNIYIWLDLRLGQLLLALVNLIDRLFRSNMI